ncbi:MAG: D-alanyl-D-alanine carboxypeptidase/D-alanyl-D-alanine-endopeptidase [Proteobacteria bacterium]|nr:D-alanyl-D-alanine carboxypeptidase/D-alanyl-D-alanine-endopeptidase [Pseudomonadota bacterium]MCL2307257.1 D-alanyl-D-alanine carboxypeptidase/D-alanyl-D-alanine-endopeptidase [Pseudomonadota bacterium]
MAREMWRRIFWVAGLAAGLAGAGTASAALPEAWKAALQQVGVPESAVAVAVQEVGAAKPLLVHRADVLMNPASVIKLVTTTAALDLLGSDYRWKTEAYLDGTLTNGVLHGNLVLKGYGDPKITIEQWQAFMQRLRQAGLTQVTGDLIVDRSLFSLSAHDPSAFDKEPLKPYNVGPDALLVSFKAVRFEFAPPVSKKDTKAQVIVEPPLAGIKIPAMPTLNNKRCGDWLGGLKPNFKDTGAQVEVRFGGSYSGQCGAREMYVALLDVPHFVHGMFTHYFTEAGGLFSGNVREGKAAGGTPWLVFESAPLSEIVQDINKRSNNVMAQQVFLTLASLQKTPPYTQGAARLAMAEWLKTNRIEMDGLYVENGSGLSRDVRVSAQGLLNLLLYAPQASWHDLFFDSLPLAGVDGTLRYRFHNSGAYSQARLKTGLLENARTLAGYVDDFQGRRYAVVILLNHANAKRSAPAMDTIIEDIYQGILSPPQQTASPKEKHREPHRGKAAPG